MLSFSFFPTAVRRVILIKEIMTEFFKNYVPISTAQEESINTYCVEVKCCIMQNDSRKLNEKEKIRCKMYSTI